MKKSTLFILLFSLMASTSQALFNAEDEAILCDKIADLGGWTQDLSLTKTDFCESYIKDQVEQKKIVKRDRYEFSLPSLVEPITEEVITIDSAGLNWSDISSTASTQYYLSENTAKGLHDGSLKISTVDAEKKESNRVASMKFGQKRVKSGGLILTADYEESYY